MDKSELYTLQKEDLKKQASVVQKALRIANKNGRYDSDLNNLRNCCNTLLISEYTDGDFVASGWRCKHRACPNCGKVKQFLHAQQARMLFKRSQEEEGNLQWLAVTLATYIPYSLDEHLARMSNAFNRLLKSKELGGRVLGYLRYLEFTSSEGYLFPHYHCVFLVKPSQYRGKYYMREDEWRTLWSEAMNHPSELAVSVSRIRPDEDKLAQAVAYAAKSEIAHLSPKLSVDMREKAVVGLLNSSKGKRTFSSGGLLKQWISEENGHDILQYEDNRGMNHAPTKRLFKQWDENTRRYDTRQLRIS